MVLTVVPGGWSEKTIGVESQEEKEVSNETTQRRAESGTKVTPLTRKDRKGYASWLGSMSSAGLECFQEEGRHALEAAVMNREHMLPAFEVRESRRYKASWEGWRRHRIIWGELGFCEDLRMRENLQRKRVKFSVSINGSEGILKGFGKPEEVMNWSR